jgi:hypothetical protein
MTYRSRNSLEVTKVRLIYPIMAFGLVENSSLRPEHIDRFGLPSGGCSLVPFAKEVH